MKTLKEELNIKIDDCAQIAGVKDKIHSYFDVFVDYLTQKGIQSFVHSANFV